MFTGIVEELGEVVVREGELLTVRAGLVVTDARPGDSIAVNGVCLTVTALKDDTFTVEVMKETFDRSSLGSISPGEKVNLERAVTPSTRLGGHIVQGHVDGVGVIDSKAPGGGWEDVRITLPSGLDRYIVEKGSITVDGISLTVVAVDETGFTVSLIPTTLALTTLGHKGVGSLVNLEVDVVAKYVEKLVNRA